MAFLHQKVIRLMFQVQSKVLDKYSSKSSLGRYKPFDRIYSTIAHTKQQKNNNIDGWMRSNYSIGLKRKSSGLFSCVSLPEFKINKFESSFELQESIEEESKPSHIKVGTIDNNDFILLKDLSRTNLTTNNRKSTLIRDNMLLSSQITIEKDIKDTVESKSNKGSIYSKYK